MKRLIPYIVVAVILFAVWKIVFLGAPPAEIVREIRRMLGFKDAGTPTKPKPTADDLDTAIKEADKPAPPPPRSEPNRKPASP